MTKKYEIDPVTLEKVPVSSGFFRRLFLVGGLVLLFVAGWFGIDNLLTSPQEQILIAENRALQEELSDSHTRVTGLMEQMEDLIERDRELYRLILQADDIPDDVRQVGVGGTDPYSHFDGFSKSTAQLLRNNAEILDELERKFGLQNASYEDLLNLGIERQKWSEQVPAILPTQGGRLSSTYGIRLHPILGYKRMHSGVDISVPTNSPVYATGGGVIEAISSDAGYGIYVLIDHPAAGYKTLYGHLKSIMPGIRRGIQVVRGEQIAYSGNTGLSVAPHVHYEVRNQDDRSLNPLPFFALSLSPQEYQKILDQVEERHSVLSLD